MLLMYWLLLVGLRLEDLRCARAMVFSQDQASEPRISNSSEMVQSTRTL
jgi:hypothetical protein